MIYEEIAMRASLPSDSIRFAVILCIASAISALCGGITPAYGREKTLHLFQGGSDGAQPYGGLINGNDGYFYGATANGGGSGCQGTGCGTIYKLGPDGT